MYQRTAGNATLRIRIQNLSKVAFGRREALSFSVESLEAHSHVTFSSSPSAFPSPSSSSSSSSSPPPVPSPSSPVVYEVNEIMGGSESEVVLGVCVTEGVPLYHRVPCILLLSYRGAVVENR